MIKVNQEFTLLMMMIHKINQVNMNQIKDSMIINKIWKKLLNYKIFQKNKMDPDQVQEKN